MEKPAGPSGQVSAHVHTQQAPPYLTAGGAASNAAVLPVKKAAAEAVGQQGEWQSLSSTACTRQSISADAVAASSLHASCSSAEAAAGGSTSNDSAVPLPKAPSICLLACAPGEADCGQVPSSAADPHELASPSEAPRTGIVGCSLQGPQPAGAHDVPAACGNSAEALEPAEGVRTETRAAHGPRVARACAAQDAQQVPPGCGLRVPGLMPDRPSELAAAPAARTSNNMQGVGPAPSLSKCDAFVNASDALLLVDSSAPSPQVGRCMCSMGGRCITASLPCMHAPCS